MMEETHYRMHLYWYKRKVKQFEILLVQMGAIHSLTTLPPPLKEPLRHTVDPIQDTDVKIPVEGTGDAGRPTSAENNVTRVATRAAIQLITKPLPLMPVTTSV